MANVKENKVILQEKEILAKMLEGAKAVYDVVSSTYGPKGKNVIIEQPFGRPVITRDGITAARAIFFSDRAKNMGAQAMIEAAETTNRNAGDATSATIGVSYKLFEYSVQAMASGIHCMDISDSLKKDSDVLTARINELSKPVVKGQLEQVASVSCGDPLIGKLISEAIEYVGDDGGIIAEKAPVNSIEREYVDGYYLQSGFTALQSGKKEIISPTVVVCIRPVRSKTDAFELLTTIAKTMQIPNDGSVIPRLLLVGNIEEGAYVSIVSAINSGAIDAIVITPPPSFGSMAKELLEDIAIYTNCKPITDVTNMRQFDASYLGSVARVVTTKSESTIFGDVQSEHLEMRIKDIKEAIKLEVSDLVVERLKDRVAKLEGKIALFRIGSPTDSAREELEFRVEDTINSTRNASRSGIVAGGGITLLELSKLPDISDISRKSLRDTFKKLLINADLQSELKLQEALDAPIGFGYNLRKSDKIVDIIKDGIVDARLSAEQVIINSTSTVANLITTGYGILLEDEKK